MPPSISHEGYSDRPAYSYWDDFWAAAGYDRRCHHRRSARQKAGRRSVRARARRVPARSRSLDRAPASRCTASTTFPAPPIAATSTPRPPPSACRSQVCRPVLPQRAARAHVRALLADVPQAPWRVDRLEGLHAVRAAQRRRLRATRPPRSRRSSCSTACMADRRPAAWNQWAEVVGRDAARTALHRRHAAWMDRLRFRERRTRSVRVRAPARSFHRACRRRCDPMAFGQRHCRGRDLRTPYGKLSYGLRGDEEQITLGIDGGITAPPGGLTFAWPFAGEPGSVRDADEGLTWKDREVRIMKVPASVSFQRRARSAK